MGLAQKQTRAVGQHRGKGARSYEILVCAQSAHTAVTKDVDRDSALARLFRHKAEMGQRLTDVIVFQRGELRFKVGGFSDRLPGTPNCQELSEN